MPGLMDFLLGNQATGSDPFNEYLSSIGVAPTSGIGTYGGGPNADGSMSAAAAPQQDPIPQTPPPVQQAAPSLPAPDQPAPVTNPNDVQVQADYWQPKHRTTLGAIADILMGTPAFAHKADADSIKSAMVGFEQDPLKSIRRVAMVNPTAAWSMYNTYADNKRLDDQAAENKQKLVYGRGMGLLATANDQNFSAVRSRYYKYMQANGIDPDQMGIGLGTTYDPDEIQGVRESGMSPAQQFNYEETSGYHDARLKQFQTDIMSKVQHRQAQEGQQALNSNRTEAYRKARLQQSGTIKGQMQPVQTKYGVGMYDPKKNILAVTVAGKEHHYAPVQSVNGKTQWRLLGELGASGGAGGGNSGNADDENMADEVDNPDDENNE